MSMTAKTGHPPRRLRTALIAAAACLALAGTAFAAVYMMNGREALEQIFGIGTYDWSVSADRQYSREFWDMFDETYVTCVDQTVQGGDMDVTLVSVVGVQDDGCYTLGYLLRFTLPEGVTLDPEIIANSGYGFIDGDGFDSGGMYWTRYNPEELESPYLPPRYSVYLLETGQPNTYYGYLTETFRQEFDGRVTLELGSFTDGAGILAEGTWRFEFEADLPQARQLAVLPVATDGNGEIASLTVSPLGVNVVLRRNEMPAEEDMDAWRDSTAVSLVMTDGTVEPLLHFIGNSEAQEGLDYRSERFHFPDAPIDLEQVAAVRVGGTEFPLN